MGEHLEQGDDRVRQGQIREDLNGIGKEVEFYSKNSEHHQTGLKQDNDMT